MTTKEPLKITREEWDDICKHPAFLRRWGLDGPPEHPQAFVYGVRFDYAGGLSGHLGPVYVLMGASASSALVLLRPPGGDLREEAGLFGPGDAEVAAEPAEPLEVRTAPLNLNKRDWERLAASAEIRARWGLDERSAQAYFRDGAVTAKFKLYIPAERPDREPTEDYFYVLLGARLGPPTLVRPDATGALAVTTPEEDAVAA